MIPDGISTLVLNCKSDSIKSIGTFHVQIKLLLRSVISVLQLLNLICNSFQNLSISGDRGTLGQKKTNIFASVHTMKLCHVKNNIILYNSNQNQIIRKYDLCPSVPRVPEFPGLPYK